MDNWIFLFLPIAGILHIIEEYVIPGGFAQAFNNLLPRASHLFTKRFHIIVNTIFIIICVIAAIIGTKNLILSLSGFGLIFMNGLLHIRGAILQKGYYPGLITSVLIYFPVTIFAFMKYIQSSQITWSESLISFLLGIAYMGILMFIVLIQQRK